MTIPLHMLRFYEEGNYLENESSLSLSIPLVGSTVILSDIHYIVDKIEWSLQKAPQNAPPTISIAVSKSASRDFPVRRINLSKHKTDEKPLTLNELIYILGALDPDDVISDLVTPSIYHNTGVITFVEPRHLNKVSLLWKLLLGLKVTSLGHYHIYVKVNSNITPPQTRPLLGFTANNILITQN